MNRPAACISLFCLTAPLAAAFFCLHLSKKMVREGKMLSGMDKKLTLLAFTEAEAEAQLHREDFEEFEYRGQMYDLATKEIKGDTIYYWCWRDDDETKINNQLKDRVEDLT